MASVDRRSSPSTLEPGRLSNRTLRGADAPSTVSASASATAGTTDPGVRDSEEVDDFVGIGRVLRSGWLYKRSKATKKWSRRWFVLRANQLVYYKDESEYKAEGMINTADIMSVAMLADQKPNHFALFTNNKNFHLRADNTPDAEAWVDIIRQAADEAAESVLCSSFERLSPLARSPQDFKKEQASLVEKLEGIQFPKNFHQPSPSMAVSPGGGAYCDFSGPEDAGMSSCTSENGLASPKPQQQPQQQAQQPQQADKPVAEEEKIVKQGYLLRLKKRYNQWRRQYVVLSTQRMAFYKNDKHKTALKVIPIGDIIDVVDIDPLSRSKRFCMQLITDRKRMRFCAENEEDLTKWLASLKSLLPPRDKQQQANN
ncbi:hypothetical protein TRICI_006889 [Trichomonascus ciferrii]|uniref:PH domain-containing protein n=1 Tax=Trichomonascus ciferrii TaxID=44093 RepID=A0A6A1LPV6_9ASCO|nr:hypothetical protein TRICI_006889 [Trichomonascus ciferrii]